MGAQYPGKRPLTAREAAARFKVSVRTVQKIFAQPRAEYLEENTISREKPWEAVNMSRASWYRHGKPTPPPPAEEAATEEEAPRERQRG